MPVYMIRAGENGPVKIGHSSDPETRLGQLQVSHWETLRIVRLFGGGEEEERFLHDRFSDQYIRGEWHHFSGAMLRDVGLAEITLPGIEYKPDAPASVAPEVIGFGINRDSVLDQALSQRLAVTRIAKRVGISTAAVSQWVRVPRRHVDAVSEITGISQAELRPDLYAVRLAASAGVAQ